MTWRPPKLPDQTGRTMVITGANSGIGLEAASMLAGLGAQVVLACRSPDKGAAAIEKIRRAHPNAQVELRRLDLASLASVREFATGFLADYGRADVLINNAGVMALPHAKTLDGFEMQFGTNHLGHFALTGLMWPALRSVAGARVVTVSSVAHWFGRIALDDPMGTKRYWRWPAYAQSKLANLLFAKELARRTEAKQIPVLSVSCHPGYASTNLQAAGARLAGWSFRERFMNGANRALAQSAAMGAYPTVHAAIAPDVVSGDFIGPDGLFELHGYPSRRKARMNAEDREVAARLWQLSEDLTGVRYEL